jgi:hypothetical protein
MTTYWYVLHGKPKKEAHPAEQLTLHQIERYSPSLRVQPVNLPARSGRSSMPV